MNTAPWSPDPATEQQMRATGWAHRDDGPTHGPVTQVLSQITEATHAQFPTDDTKAAFAAGVALVLESLTFLAEARSEYLPNHEPHEDVLDTDKGVRTQVHATKQLRNMLAGEQEAWGWLPTWFGHLWEPRLAMLQNADVPAWEKAVHARGMAAGIREGVATVCSPAHPYGHHQTYCEPLLAMAAKIDADLWVRPAEGDIPLGSPTVEEVIAAKIADSLDQVDFEAANHVRLEYELPNAVHIDD